MTTPERPALVFNMFEVDRPGITLVASEIQRFFGRGNYDEFRRAGKTGEDIPTETRQRVDREIYERAGKMFHISGDLKAKEIFWKNAMRQSNATVNYARGILFDDQDRRATMTNNIAWDEGRPSSALERLTMPIRLIGKQCKYEQGRQLGFGLLSAEVMSRDENGISRAILGRINNFLESKLFIGRKGDPEKYHIFSYHTPGTNRLVGLSSQYPDPNFEEGLWVKSLDFPVRKLGIRDSKGEIVEIVSALYDPREKEVESAVIKADERSLLTARSQPNGGLIETSPYGGDQLGFRLVVMEGGHPLRDRVTSNLEELFRTFEGVQDIQEDNQVDENHGEQDRIQFRRRLIFIEGLNNPIELMVYSLGDWISQEYEVGNFNGELGMHDGRGHDLYKLQIVSNVAKYLWPFKIFGIDLEYAKKDASFDYAARLGRKQRIYPSPYAA